MRAAFGLPVLRRLTVRRRLWSVRNWLARARRRLFERLRSDRYSHPALHDLDRKLARYLPNENGVFVEAGAYDGFIQSNTYWFERFRGWRGVLIEPVPHLYRDCVRERRGSQVFQCALVPDGEKDAVALRYGGLMSVVRGALGSRAGEDAHASAGDMHGLDDSYEIEVPARTLTSVLDEAGVGEVDLLSLDVEGYEASVLRGLDLDRHAPRFILVEMDEAEARRSELERVLGGRYEAVERLSPMDLLYARSD